MASAEGGQSGDATSGGSLFSFANSLNSMTEVQAKNERALTDLSPTYPMGGSAAEHGEAGDGAQLLCEASPMNVSGIYKATVLFTSEMEKVVAEAALGGAGHEPQNTRQASSMRLSLTSFINTFLGRAYIPIIHAEVQSRLTSIAETADKPLDDHGHADAPRVLFRSTTEVDEIVGQLCGLMLDLPFKCADFTEMLLRLITRCVSRAPRNCSALLVPTAADSFGGQECTMQTRVLTGVGTCGAGIWLSHSSGLKVLCDCLSLPKGRKVAARYRLTGSDRPLCSST